jgi:indolepyruvate ferredoxin oxidoreductase alpha subunit
MTRFVVDASAMLHLAAEQLTVAPGHELLAPPLLKSQTLSALHEEVWHGRLTDAVAREHLERVNAIKVRLLGDAVLRRTAWKMADELHWAATYATEYLALTRLQADFFVTLDEQLIRTSKGIVPIAGIEALTTAPEEPVALPAAAPAKRKRPTAS